MKNAVNSCRKTNNNKQLNNSNSKAAERSQQIGSIFKVTLCGDESCIHLMESQILEMIELCKTQCVYIAIIITLFTSPDSSPHLLLVSENSSQFSLPC